MEKGQCRTYNRPHEIRIILLELLQRILGIAGALDELRNPIRHLFSRTTNTADGRDVVENVAKLVCCRGCGGNLQLELATLLLCVAGVVASLVFCGSFASGCGSLFQDVEGSGGCLDGGGVEEGDGVEGFGLIDGMLVLFCFSIGLYE